MSSYHVVSYGSKLDEIETKELFKALPIHPDGQEDKLGAYMAILYVIGKQKTQSILMRLRK